MSWLTLRLVRRSRWTHRERHPLGLSEAEQAYWDWVLATPTKLYETGLECPVPPLLLLLHLLLTLGQCCGRSLRIHLVVCGVVGAVVHLNAVTHAFGCLPRIKVSMD